MKQTTKVMFTYYMMHDLALDVVWMRKRRNLILCEGFSLAMIKSHSIYSDAPCEIIERQQDYPSPLFSRAKIC